MEIKLFEDVLQAPWSFATIAPTQATQTHSSGVATDQDGGFFVIFVCVDVSPDFKDPAQLMDMTVKTTLASPCHTMSAFTKTVHKISLCKNGWPVSGIGATLCSFGSGKPDQTAGSKYDPS
jgi:hypothetical protein